MFFGAEVSFAGDIDGDGSDEVAVGTPFFDPPPDRRVPTRSSATSAWLRIYTSKRSRLC